MKELAIATALLVLSSFANAAETQACDPGLCAVSELKFCLYSTGLSALSTMAKPEEVRYRIAVECIKEIVKSNASETQVSGFMLVYSSAYNRLRTNYREK